jgi:cytochrome oxidase assembly protein ShyY1
VLRRLLTPRWILALLLTLAGAAIMVRLGMWQLGRGEKRHSLQNYSYAVEWVLFAGFAVFVFVKLLKDEVHGVEEPADAGGPEPAVVVKQRPAVEEPEDDELAAYNAYLARLNQQSR